MKKSFLAVSLFAVCIVMIAGCGGKKDNGTTINVAFWGTPEEKEIILDSVKSWEAANPEITLKMEHTPAGGYVQKMLTRIAGGAAPDILAIRVDQFVTFATKNVLLDLTPYIQADPKFQIKDYFAEVVENFSYEGKIYAIPRDTAPYACIFYNKDAFEARGVEYPTDDWTWDDLLAKAKALTGVDEKGRKYYGYYGWSWENFVYSNGGDLVDNVKYPTRTLMDKPEAVDGLQFYADLINVHKVMPTPVALANTGMGVDMMFADGNIAMFQSGIWETPALRKYPDLKWDVVMFPKSPKGIHRIGTGGTAYGILKSSKNPKKAWEVLKSLSGPEGQIQLAEQGLAQPALRAISEGEAFAGNDLDPKNKAMLNEAVQYVVYDPFHEKWNEAKAKYIIPELELLFNGKKTAAEATANFKKPVDEMLQEA